MLPSAPSKVAPKDAHGLLGPLPPPPLMPPEPLPSCPHRLPLSSQPATMSQLSRLQALLQQLCALAGSEDPRASEALRADAESLGVQLVTAGLPQDPQWTEEWRCDATACCRRPAMKPLLSLALTIPAICAARQLVR